MRIKINKENLTRAMAIQGLDYKDLGSRCFVSKSAITKLFQKSLATPRTIKRILAITDLNISPEELLGSGQAQNYVPQVTNYLGVPRHAI